MFEIDNSKLTMFRARPPVLKHAPARVVLGPAAKAKLPELDVSWEKTYFAWWGSLKTVLARVHLNPLRESIQLFRNTPVLPFRFPGGSFVGSIVLHGAAFLLLPFLLAFLPNHDVIASSEYSEPQIIYYQIPTHDSQEVLPRITPKGEGGQPGAGELQALLQKIGSTTSARRIVIVSKPIRPDNKRQTIYQPATPPDLQIDMDLKLPNVVGGPSVAPAKPKLHFTPNTSKPLQAHRSAARETAPTLAATNAAMPTNLPPATVAQPHLAVPLNESRPRQAQVQIGEVSAPSLSPTNVATATNLGDSYRTGQPAGPVAPPSDPDASGSGKASNKNALQTAGDGTGIVVVSVDPAEAAALVNLPAGNRWGDFTIAPGGGQPGAVGGSEHGMPGAGNNSTGAGGDRVPGVGPGYAGGGGGNSGSSGSVSITGNTGDAGGGALDPNIIADMVYPVPATLVLRRNALVVSAGPMGGGGINAYGALHCAKIYTVFLAMPGKSWTLEFCQSGKGQVPVQSHSSVIHMDQGILAPDAEAKFDFRRAPVPFEKLHKPIVLKGVIKDDGTVDSLEIYRSIVPVMDEAARVAFRKWKFKPALRDGKPVSVDILVAIPTEPVPPQSK